MSRKARGETHFRLAGVLGSAVLGALGRSLRYRCHDREHFLRFRREGRPVVFVFWHSHLLPLAYLHRREGVVVLVSSHSDGEYIARIVQRGGFELARGSSTRGGARGLRELIRALRSGRDVAITPDGPRGPRHRVKPGALLAAQATGSPIIPVAVRASRAWFLNSWDRFLVPRPFARIEVRYGDPRWVPRDLDEVGLAKLAAEVGSVLARLDRAGAGDGAGGGAGSRHARPRPRGERKRAPTEPPDDLPLCDGTGGKRDG